MASKLRREKDIITRVTDDYQTATTELYQKYLSGSPVYVTYYQFYAPGSTTDNSLEDVHSLTGSNSPNKYRVIEDFPMYGLEQLDIENNITERGLESLINSTLIVLPQTIIPTAHDFLAFQVNGMETELFQIVQVNFDRVHANRYYQIVIDLYKENVNEILENCISTRYVYDEDDNNGTASGTGAEDGSIGGSIIPVDQKEVKDGAEKLYDSMLEQFQKLYYDADLDQFVYRGYGKNHKAISFWSPYLQKFLYETKVLSYYGEEIMTEFYVRDINSFDYGEDVFNDYCWDNCFYKAILTESEFEERHSYIAISGLDLKDYKMLPFFCSAGVYKMVDFDLGPKSWWMNAFHISKDPLLDEPVEPFGDAISAGKIKDENFDASKYEYGDYVYDGNIPPESVYIIRDLDDSKYADKIIFPNIVNSDDLFEREFGRIFSGTFKLDTETIKAFNTYHYRKSLKNFLMFPVILYAIKTKISELATA